MSTQPYKAPSFDETSFNCPFCNAFSNQTWINVRSYSGSYDAHSMQDIKLCFCVHCERYSIWNEEVMVYPDFSNVEPPNEDLNNAIKDDYKEAASILQKSPRGAAALLRLCVQKLCVQLGESGKNIDTDIGNLVKNGLPVRIQQSLDALRVIGNESVHPGTIDLRDDPVMAVALFKLLNKIAETMITEPREIQEIYNKIPNSKKSAIDKRDSDASN